jgi:hypothetical protein
MAALVLREVAPPGLFFCWTPVVRVAGSWIAAAGLLLRDWTLRPEAPRDPDTHFFSSASAVERRDGRIETQLLIRSLRRVGYSFIESALQPQEDRRKSLQSPANLSAAGPDAPHTEKGLRTEVEPGLRRRVVNSATVLWLR